MIQNIPKLPPGQVLTENAPILIKSRLGQDKTLADVSAHRSLHRNAELPHTRGFCHLKPKSRNRRAVMGEGIVGIWCVLTDLPILIEASKSNFQHVLYLVCFLQWAKRKNISNEESSQAMKTTDKFVRSQSDLGKPRGIHVTIHLHFITLWDGAGRCLGPVLH